MVDAIADIHIETPWLTKERFITGGAAAEAVAGGVVLGVRLRFHHHTPEQAAVLSAFHQQATDEVGGDQLGGAGEEGLREGWEGFYGFRSGLGRVGWRLLGREVTKQCNPKAGRMPRHRDESRNVYFLLDIANDADISPTKP